MDEQTTSPTEFFNKKPKSYLPLFVGIVLFIIVVFILFSSMPHVPQPFNTSNPVEFICSGLIIIFTFGVLLYSYLKMSAGQNILVNLDKPAFALGEQITGSVLINKNITNPAKSVKLLFYGLDMRPFRLGGGKRIRICKQETVISGARTFRKGESIPFSINMPESVNEYLGADKNSADKFVSETLGGVPFLWYLEAKFDMPGEIAISNIADLQIIFDNNKAEKPVEKDETQ